MSDRTEAEIRSGVSLVDWSRLIERAAQARDFARLLPDGKTRVGAAVLGDDHVIYAGCNIQHKYRCDMHAERVAIGNAVAVGGCERILALVVVAERQLFLPCGECMDWIFELGGPVCEVAFTTKPGVGPTIFRARQLMPFYPE